MNLQTRIHPARPLILTDAYRAYLRAASASGLSRKAVVDDRRPVTTPTTRTAATLPRTSSDHLRGHLHAYKPNRVATYEAAIEFQRKAAASGQSVTFVEAVLATTRKG